MPEPVKIDFTSMLPVGDPPYKIGNLDAVPPEKRLMTVVADFKGYGPETYLLEPWANGAAVPYWRIVQAGYPDVDITVTLYSDPAGTVAELSYRYGGELIGYFQVVGPESIYPDELDWSEAAPDLDAVGVPTVTASLIPPVKVDI